MADVNDVKTGLIKSRRIVFTPSVDLKEELANTSIQITCYDRDGKVVKRVTSDAGEVEDPEENENESPSPNSPEGEGNTNQGGGTTNSGNDNTNTDPDPDNQGGGDNNSGGFDEG